jgi:hypothetical protein
MYVPFYTLTLRLAMLADCYQCFSMFLQWCRVLETLLSHPSIHPCVCGDDIFSISADLWRDPDDHLEWVMSIWWHNPSASVWGSWATRWVLADSTGFYRVCCDNKQHIPVTSATKRTISVGVRFNDDLDMHTYLPKLRYKHTATSQFWWI